jgi:tetratricopeptide (TPR) repeat protein
MAPGRGSAMTPGSEEQAAYLDGDETSPASDQPTGAEASSGEPKADHRPLAGSLSGLALAPVVAASDFASPAPAGSPAAAEIGGLNSAALAKLSAKDYPAAIDLLARALQLDPLSPSAHGNLAVAMWRARRAPRAEALCRRAIALDPNYLPAQRLLAELLRERNDVAAALACYERLFALDADNAITHNNFGLLLCKAKRFDEARAAFARARALRPDDPAVRFNELTIRPNDSGLAEAIDCCREALEQNPDNANVLTNLSVSLQFAGRYGEAVDYAERAIAVDPEHYQAHFNLSLLLLLRGEFARGWREYEQRWRLPEVTKPNYREPLWAGEPLDGKTILLQSEQGLGDTIQCLRYVPLVLARGGRVALRLERVLVRLAASLPGSVIITPTSARLPEFDVWCPLLSLPRVLGTQMDSIPASVPYLGARNAIAERWRRRLGGLPGLKVGLVWAGSANHINDARRSMKLERLKPLFEIPGMSFVSLQVGPRAADLAALPTGAAVDVSAELTDFAETAGAIRNLDLVIAVDTSVVHLAGALGKAAWAMLPFSPDWRWLLERADSPWYPTVRLYRQSAPADWDSVVARVGADLAALASERARHQHVATEA